MKRSTVVKTSYFMLLMTFLTWFVNNFAGGFVYSRAEGMVVGEPGSISSEFPVTILDIPVRNGDLVKKGDIVARVSSTQVATVTATLSAQSSALITKLAEVTAKAGMMDQLLSGAEARDRTVSANARDLQEVRNKKLLPILTDNAVAEQLFKGKQELAVLRAEKETMAQQLAQVIAASRFTDQAIADVQTLFDAGRMRAPMSGYIAGVEASVGSVVMPGSVVAEMVGEQRYVLAYFQTDRMFEVKDGDPVTVDVGLGSTRMHGTITRVMPIAARLPKEFQKTLSPVERQQIVRIDFDKDVTPPPYFAKVVVR